MMRGLIFFCCLAMSSLTAQVAAPKKEEPPPHPLAKAGVEAIMKGNIPRLKELLAAGLPVDATLKMLPSGTDPGWSGLTLCCIFNKPEVLKFLLEQGANRKARDRNGKRPIDYALEKRNEALCKMLAVPESKETMVDGFPRGMLAEIFKEREYQKKAPANVSFNDNAPSENLLNAMKNLGDPLRPMALKKNDPADMTARYRDLKGQPTRLFEIHISSDPDGLYRWSIRNSTGPSMAGGGQRGSISRQYGYWVISDLQGWDE